MKSAASGVALSTKVKLYDKSIESSFAFCSLFELFASNVVSCRPQIIRSANTSTYFGEAQFLM